MNSVYDGARYDLLTASLDWPGDPLRLVAWSGELDFTPADRTVADITTRALAAVVGSSLPITVQSVSANGTAQTNQVVIPAPPVGPPVTFFTMGRKAPAVGNDELILYIDQALGLPFIPNGLDLVVQPDFLQARGWWRP